HPGDSTANPCRQNVRAASAASFGIDNISRAGRVDIGTTIAAARSGYTDDDAQRYGAVTCSGGVEARLDSKCTAFPRALGYSATNTSPRNGTVRQVIGRLPVAWPGPNTSQYEKYSEPDCKNATQRRSLAS